MCIYNTFTCNCVFYASLIITKCENPWMLLCQYCKAWSLYEITDVYDIYDLSLFLYCVCVCEYVCTVCMHSCCMYVYLFILFCAVCMFQCYGSVDIADLMSEGYVWEAVPPWALREQEASQDHQQTAAVNIRSCSTAHTETHRYTHRYVNFILKPPLIWENQLGLIWSFSVSTDT